MDQGSRARSDQKLPQVGRKVYLGFIYCLFAYALYSWMTFTGAYPWIAELEVAHFGSYDVNATFLILVIGLVLVPAVLVLVPIHVVRKLRGLPTVNLTAPAAVPAKPMSPANERRIYLGIGALGLVMFLVGGAITYNKSQRVVTFVPFDVSGGVAPTSDYVELTGIAVPRMQLQFEEKSSGHTTTTTYIPVLPQGWKKGDPVTYFLRPNFTYYASEAGSHPMDADSPAFRIKQTGVLFRDDLPGLIGARYEQLAIKLGTPPIVLDTNPRSELAVYWGITFAGGIMVVMTPMLLIGLRIKNARARKRARA
jgi:hypothetical protein